MAIPRKKIGDKFRLVDNNNLTDAVNLNEQLIGVAYDEFGNRLTAVESSITVQAGQIALKVSQSDFNALGIRVSNSESSIVQNAQQIALKVSTIEFNELGQKVLQNSSSITQLAGSITSKVNRTEFNTLGDRVSTAETQIQQTATDISLKANQSALNTLTGRVESTEASIVLNSQQIALKVNSSDFNTLTQRVVNSESAIVQNASAISLRVTQTDFNGLGARVTTAESAITVNANNINLKVSASDYNGNNLVSMINQTASNITISANKIDLVGQVTITALKKGTGTDALLTVDGLVKADRIDVNSLVATNIQATTGTIAGFRITPTRLEAGLGGSTINTEFAQIYLENLGGTGQGVVGFGLERRKVTGVNTSEFVSNVFKVTNELGSAFFINKLETGAIQTRIDGGASLYTGKTNKIPYTEGGQTRFMQFVNGVMCQDGLTS